MKNHLIAAAVVLLVGGGCMGPGPAVRYDVRPMLLATDAEGKETPTYLGTDGETGAIAVSPDQKHVVHASWEEAHYVIYLVDLPAQTSSRKIAEQTIPEGGGGLDPTSLLWIDDRTIQYRESGVACGETGEPSLQNPTKDCDGSIVLTYRVDIGTGEKTLTDRWMETIKPLQP